MACTYVFSNAQVAYTLQVDAYELVEESPCPKVKRKGKPGGYSAYDKGRPRKFLVGNRQSILSRLSIITVLWLAKAELHTVSTVEGLAIGSWNCLHT